MVQLTVSCFIAILGFESETALVDYVTTNKGIGRFGALVFFVSGESDKLPKKITYKIRLRSEYNIEWKIDSMFSEGYMNSYLSFQNGEIGRFISKLSTSYLFSCL